MHGALSFALAFGLSACACEGDASLDGSAGASDGGAAGTDAGADPGTMTGSGRACAPGFTCTDGEDPDVVWVMRDEGNVNGPTCSTVCRDALSDNCAYYACDAGRDVEYPDIGSFAAIAAGLGFTCRPGGCWWPDAPGEGMYLVSIDADEDGTRSCFFPTETQVSCETHPGNANCFGERYASVCPCVVRPLDEACNWDCAPHNTTRAVWRTEGTSCLARINYWRMRACEEGWVECPPAGLPPMVECTGCHECANSEAEHDQEHGAHDSFGRCGENAQGEGGGATCADVIDAFVSERAPDEDGVMRCQGHCGPILRPGCRSFSWGKDRDTAFHTLNWGGCNADACQSYCDDNSGACFTHETSPSLACDDPAAPSEANPAIQVCE